MTNEELNTRLYEKMAAEQTQYRNWLLTLPPAGLLQHAYEYSVREDSTYVLEDNYILIKLHRITGCIDCETAHIASKYNLTLSQFGVLEALYHVGDLTVGEVKKKILSSDGTIPVVVKNLEKRGLLFRKQDPADKRKSILSLTEQGRILIEKAYPENEKMIREQLSAWTKEEKKQLTTLLKKFRAEDQG
jgi:MarR family 2-MHQ and catechol resistance regulon transcriptional repressor